MKIGIVSSIGKQSYHGKYKIKKDIWSPFWNLCLFEDGRPIDVVDYYNRKYGNPDLIKDENRHIYNNGILLANRLNKDNNIVKIFNNLNDSDTIAQFDLFVISTNYVFYKWSEELIAILEKLRKSGIKSILGGVGINKIFYNNKKLFQEIKKLVNGYIIISENGLNILTWAIKNINTNNCKILFDESKYSMNANDFSLKDINVKLHSTHTTFLTQQGCIYNCTFCSYKEKIKEHTYFPLNTVKKALKQTYYTRKKKLKHLRIVDETFNLNLNKAYNFCNFLISQKFNFNWSCFLRGDNITEKLAKSLKLSNCTLVSIGVESGNARLQKSMNKNLNLNKTQNGIFILKKYGITVNISLILGFCGETDRTILDTINFIKTSKPDLARINIWYPSVNEKNAGFLERNGLVFKNGIWNHNTMTEKEAVKYAREIYLMNSSTVFIPPFSSIFDQWPVLASYGLPQKKILQIFKSYYMKTKQIQSHK